MRFNVKKLALAGMMTALGVCLSACYIPVGASKCFPIQHLLNVLSGVFLGPGYALGFAFSTSLIFGGASSMIGASCSTMATIFASAAFMQLSPPVPGISLFTCTMTFFAALAAGSV